jgi:hypothetical protein
MAVLAASPVCAQEGVFLSEEQAPAAVFPTNAVPPPTMAMRHIITAVCRAQAATYRPLRFP